MTDRRQFRIEYTFRQNYDNWRTPEFIDNFDARVNTFDILERLDQLEVDVYRDRDYVMANELIEASRSKYSS